MSIWRCRLSLCWCWCPACGKSRCYFGAWFLRDIPEIASRGYRVLFVTTRKRVGGVVVLVTPWHRYGKAVAFPPDEWGGKYISTPARKEKKVCFHTSFFKESLQIISNTHLSSLQATRRVTAWVVVPNSVRIGLIFACTTEVMNPQTKKQFSLCSLRQLSKTPKIVVYALHMVSKWHSFKAISQKKKWKHASSEIFRRFSVGRKKKIRTRKSPTD